MAETKSTDFKSLIASLEDNLELYFGKKAPQLPSDWKEFLVKIAPYLAIIGLVFGIWGVLTLLGLSAFILPLGTMGGMMAGRPFVGFYYLLTVVFMIPILVLEALAISPLFKRSIKGWRYMFYASLLGVLQSLVQFNLTGLIIGGAISFYLLFQVKSFYK